MRLLSISGMNQHAVVSGRICVCNTSERQIKHLIVGVVDLKKKRKLNLFNCLVICAVVLYFILFTDLDIIIFDMIGTVGVAIYDLIYMIFG